LRVRNREFVVVRTRVRQEREGNITGKLGVDMKNPSRLVEAMTMTRDQSIPDETLLNEERTLKKVTMGAMIQVLPASGAAANSTLLAGMSNAKSQGTANAIP
jgi:hypothetical protein